MAICLPRGPLICIAADGASIFRDRAFDRGRSINCKETSGGMGMGSLPILDARGIDEEK
jgi:hypothetical protein